MRPSISVYVFGCATPSRAYFESFFTCNSLRIDDPDEIFRDFRNFAAFFLSSGLKSSPYVIDKLSRPRDFIFYYYARD